MRNGFRLSLMPAVLAGLFLFAGCNVQQAIEQLSSLSSGESSGDSKSLPPARNGESIRIASFNIQVFGESKEKKTHVMEVLADVVRRFDLVAIQEVRAMDQDLIPRFVDRVNAAGAYYDHVLGERLGRTTSKEQYAMLFDTTRVELIAGSVYTVNDRNDRLHREPLVAAFRVRGPPSTDAFTFQIVNIHTDPDETDTELDALADVFVSVRDSDRDEDDVILLGDLNVDEYHLGRLGRLPSIAWALSGVTTNTRGTKSYDNMVFDRRATAEYTGRSGVFNLMREFQLTKDQALEVSDHLPVWAEFSAREARVGPLARTPDASSTR